MPRDPEPSIDFAHSLLLTDLYQLNMVEAYLASDMHEQAVFEFFTRKLPSKRNFLVAAGLEQVIGFLLEARCSDSELEWLRATGRFTDQLFRFLKDFRFSGDVDAMPEGTVFFGDEPILRITAPIAQAQLLETRIINFLQYQTMIASKAARMVLAAPGRHLVDFGLRRAHSGEAGLLAARAAYIAGFDGTATVPADQYFDIPIIGTMAHSFIQAHDTEEAAFLNFASARPDQTVFLVDTYDTEAATRKVTEIAPILVEKGIEVKGIRLDSGDLAEHAFRTRNILDEAGLNYAQIVASGGIDEYALAELTKAKAPIDSYGIGTSLVTSQDHPALDCAYKLKAYAGTPRRKKSEGKTFWPGATQVFRVYNERHQMLHDTIARADEKLPGRALLRSVVRGGQLVGKMTPIGEIREYAAEEVERLPEVLKRLEPNRSYPVNVSDALRVLASEVDEILDNQRNSE